MLWKAILGLICAALLYPAHALAQQGTVRETAVKLQLTGGYVGPETLSQLEQAINDTVSTALIEQLDGDLSYILQHQRGVVKTLGEVITPVLSKLGFALEELSLEPGEVSTVNVSLHLAETLVESFTVQFNLLGNTEVIAEVVASDEEAVASALFSTVARTPYGDTRWFTGLVSQTVESALSRLAGYGDFDHVVLVEPGVQTKVSVTFTPNEGVAVLSDYTLTMSSLTLLTTTLAPVRDRVAHHIQAMLGAPLSFFAPRLDQIQRAIYQDLVNCGPLAELSADACLSLVANGCVVHADLCIDSQRYIMGLNAKLDLWDHSDDTGYLGRLNARVGFIPHDEWVVYADAHYFPAAGEGFPMLGLARLWKPQSFIGAGYDFNAKAIRLQGQHAFNPLVYVSADVFTGDGFERLSEFALHYRVRDFYELQLLTNLDGEVYAAVAANF